MDKSDSEKIIQKYSKRPLDLKTAKRIIYQYNRNQLHLAKVEFDDNHSSKSVNKLEFNNNKKKIEKKFSSDNNNNNLNKSDIYTNNPYYYEEVIIETVADDWNKVSKIVNNISLSYITLISDNSIKNKVKKEENNNKINENLNNHIIENKNEKINNGKMQRDKFDESKNKIKFEEIKINIPGKSNIKYNNNYENSKLKYDKLKEDFQINKLEIIPENKIINIDKIIKTKKENFNGENSQINYMNDKDDNIPTSIDSKNQDSKIQISIKREKLDEKNILNEIKNISEIIGKVNNQISNCEKIGNKKETINLNNNKDSLNNKEKSLINFVKNNSTPNLITRNTLEENKKEDKQYITNSIIFKSNEIFNINNKTENTDNNKTNIINENLIKNINPIKESYLNNFKESRNQIIEDKNKILFEKYSKDNFRENKNNFMLTNNQENSISNNKIVTENCFEKKAQNNFLKFDNLKDGKTITFRKEDIKNQFDNEKKENKALTYEDMKKLFLSEDIKKENNQLNKKQKNLEDFNCFKIKNNEEIEKYNDCNDNENLNKNKIKLNIKDLNDYLLNHMKLEKSNNIKKKKEDYDFFNESHKVSIIKNPNNVGIEFIKINYKSPTNKMKKNINGKKNSSTNHKKNINSEINNVLQYKKIENKSKENIHNFNIFELSDIEKHKQNQTTLDEIRNLLINNNKSSQNIFIKEEQINKQIEDKLNNKNSFENSSIFKTNKIIQKKNTNNSISDDYNKMSFQDKIKYKVNKSIKELNNSIPKNLEDLNLYKSINYDKSLMSYNPKTGKKEIPKYKELESKVNKLIYDNYSKNHKYSPIHLIYNRGKSTNKYRTDRINYSNNYKRFIYPSNNIHDSFLKIHSKG